MSQLTGAAMILSGVITLLIVQHKPHAFWNKASVRSVKNLIGDKGATLFYQVIGVTLCLSGIYILLS
jgi:predicted phage tail protein